LDVTTFIYAQEADATAPSSTPPEINIVQLNLAAGIDKNPIDTRPFGCTALDAEGPFIITAIGMNFAIGIDELFVFCDQRLILDG